MGKGRSREQGRSSRSGASERLSGMIFPGAFAMLTPYFSREGGLRRKSPAGEGVGELQYGLARRSVGLS